MDINMELDKPKIHNNFKFVVKDSKTGAIKQEYLAENIVLDAFYAYYFNNDSVYNPAYLCYGDGSGTPELTGTNLFNYKGEKAIENIKVDTKPDLITMSGKIKFESVEYNGGKISEVGLGYSYFGSPKKLLTHAMLRDISGNAIVLGPKTEADIWEIFITAYVERSENMSSFPNAWSDRVILKSDSSPSNITLMSFYLRPSNFGVEENGTYQSSDKTRISTLKTAEVGMANSSNTYASGLSTDITQLDFPILKQPIIFPNPEIFPRFTFSERTIGVGDGKRKGFNLDSGYFVEGTETVKVNGIVKKLGVDYTLRQGARQSLVHPYHIPDFPNKATIIQDLKDKTEKIKKYRISSSGGIGDYIGGNVHKEYEAHVIYDLGEIVSLDEYSFSVFLQGTSNYYGKAFIRYSFSLDGVTWSTPQKTKIQTIQAYYKSPEAYHFVRTPDMSNIKYVKVEPYEGEYTKNMAPITLTPLRESSIMFTEPPALSDEVRASWSTDIPPKNENFTYKIQWKLKNNS